MTKRYLLTFSAIAVFAVAALPRDIVAQQKSLKEQLVGTWIVVSNEQTAPNGTKESFYGVNPKGVLIFDTSGRYATVLARPDRAKLKSGSRFDQDATAAELKAVLLGFAANSGTWSVNEADRTLTRRFEAALIPNNEGSEQKDSITLIGDELKLSRTNPVSGVRVEGVYRRAK